MNIRNLVSTALGCAGMNEDDYHVRVRQETSIYVSIHAKYANKSIHVILQTEEDGLVSDFMIDEENLSAVIGEEVYERFIDRMMEETFVYM